MKRVVKMLAAMAILYESGFAQTCTTTPQVNAVINGDFESGYIASGPGSFVSDQLYVYDPSNSANSTLMDNILASPTADGPCAWNSDGKFHVGSYFGTYRCSGQNWDGHPFLTEANNRYDHTQGIGGTGKYLMIDSKNGAATGLGIILWQQNVNVVANSQYYFSGWFINYTPNSTGANRVDLRFVVEYFDASNVSLGVFQLGSQFSPAETSRGNSWEQAYVTTTSPAGAVTAKIGIYNQTANVLVGNDVAIDDISFSNGCQAITTAANPPAPGLGSDLNLCAVSGNLTLNSGVATNAPTREFSWYSVSGSTETLLTGPSTTQNTYTVSAPGTYRVCVYEPSGCAKSDYITVTATNSINLGTDQNLCDPAFSGTVTGTLATTGATYTYNWLRNGSAIAGTTNSQTGITTSGTYTINGVHPSRAACNVTDNVIISQNNLTTNIGADANLCNSSTATFTSSATHASFTYQWQRDGVNIPGATSSSYTATIPGTYRLNITQGATGCTRTDDAVVTNSNTVTANNANFCAPPATAVNLSVTGTGTFNWFDAPTNGNTVATNTTSFTTPAISNTTTYYVQDMTTSSGTSVPGGSFGVPDNSPNFFSSDNSIPEGIVFNTLKNNVTLTSVDVWVHDWSQAANVVLDIVNSSGTTIGSTTSQTLTNWGTGSPVKMTIPINIALPTSGTYKMLFRMTGGAAGVLRKESPVYPITEATNTITITGTNDVGGNYFRNLQFTAGANPCARIPVTAYLTGSCPLPLFEDKDERATAEEKLEMNVYPNPVHSSLTVELETGVTEADYSISEMSGKHVLEGFIYGSSKSIDVNSLPKGIYILEVKNSTKVAYSKIIKD